MSGLKIDQISRVVSREFNVEVEDIVDSARAQLAALDTVDEIGGNAISRSELDRGAPLAQAFAVHVRRAAIAPRGKLEQRQGFEPRLFHRAWAYLIRPEASARELFGDEQTLPVAYLQRHVVQRAFVALLAETAGNDGTLDRSELVARFGGLGGTMYDALERAAKEKPRWQGPEPKPQGGYAFVQPLADMVVMHGNQGAETLYEPAGLAARVAEYGLISSYSLGAIGNTRRFLDFRTEQALDRAGKSEQKALYAAANQRMYEVLDHQFLFTTDTRIAYAFFAKQLDKLVQRRDVVSYLSEFRHKLQASVERGVAFDFWQLTRRRAGSDEEAIRWLAVLLQDTMLTECVSWVAAKRLARPSVVADIRDIHRMLNHGDLRAVQGYPDADIKHPPSSPYHYYVPAYLAQRLESEFGRSAPRVLQVMMGYLYESVIMSANLDGVWEGMRKTLGLDPALFDPRENEQHVGDMYVAYRAAYRGEAVLSFEEFGNQIGSHPQEFFQALIAGTSKPVLAPQGNVGGERTRR